jgi:ubiquinone/menaquinone biosynthesis C-methylase UbiE
LNEIVNPFTGPVVGELYTRARPRLHHLVIERVAKLLEIRSPLSRAVDVGCGTGMSSLALAAITERVLALDVSADMLRHAERHPAVRYAIGTAESLPLASDSVDLVSVSAAMHWFDQSAFLAESHRVLHAGGSLVIYDVAPTGRIQELGSFPPEFVRRLLDRYPNVPSHPRFQFAEDRAQGFLLVAQERYEYVVRMSVEEYVAWFLTASNVVAAVAAGRETLEEAETWNRREAETLFAEEPQLGFIFGGPIWCLARV